MTFGESVRKGVDILKLDRATIREVANRPEAFTPALLINVIAGLAMWLYPFHLALHGIVTGPLFALGLLFVSGIVLHFAATLLDGRGEYLTLLRTWGLSRVLGWAWAIPIAGMIVDLWSFVVAVVVLEEVYGLHRPQAVLAVVVPALAVLALSAIAFLNLMVLGGLLSLGRFL
ncbi:MAG: hypothetical protein KBD56_04815 [Candidatus Eisenbacteria bacterium]|nr:hypothetical protein [Candidatus Eisenbacteria bacterium]